LNELADMFLRISNKMTALPPTAQVANQQGVYLGKKFTALVKAGVLAPSPVSSDYTLESDESMYKQFTYKHLGSLASLGSAGAAFDLDGYGSFAGGLIAMYAWRSIYWSEQTSMRTRAMLMMDWVKRGIFGCDLCAASDPRARPTSADRRPLPTQTRHLALLSFIGPTLL
jgi:NADH dehydrogenase FAD-containing subunit